MSRVAGGLCLLAAAATFSSATAGTPHWNGPGYYILENFLGWTVDEGPYATESKCEAVLAKKAAPTDTDDFRCDFFQHEADINHELNQTDWGRKPSE